MYETGADEEEARDYIKGLMKDTWKSLNEERVAISSVLPKTYVDIVVNLVRMTLYMYHGGDRVGVQKNNKTKDTILALLVNPLSLDCEVDAC